MTPDEWLNFLRPKLATQQSAARKLYAYYDGKHPLPDGPQRARDEYRTLLEKSRSNWMELVVRAALERINVVGWRRVADHDPDMWALWRTNRAPVWSSWVHLDALVTGRGFVSLWDVNGAGVTMAAESPLETITWHTGPGDRERLAALKIWSEPNMNPSNRLGEMVSRAWVQRYDPAAGISDITYFLGGTDQSLEPDGATRPNGFQGRGLPVVRFTVNDRAGKTGRSDLSSVTDIQDRINETLFGRVLASWFTAFRQRYATGLGVDVDDNGDPIEPFNSAVDRLWVAEDPDVKFGEFGETDLRGYIASVEADIQHLAAISRTPPHYLLGQSGAFPSGESLKSTETGLVARCQGHMTSLGGSWDTVAELAVGAMPGEMEVVWGDPEHRTEGELVDALLKMRSLGVPLEELWERWGASPDKIAKWRALLLEASLLEPVPAAVDVGAG